MWSSTASTAVTPSKFEACAHPVPSVVQYCHENTTSAAVKGVPSDHWMSGFSFQVTVVRSSLTPPFSSVGISVARIGTMFPSWS